jgi:predicted branched-subunit amino acid permease
MIEFLVIYHFWSKVADRVHARGYDRAIGFQLLFLAAWFIGELIGAVVGILVLGVPPDTGGMFVVYMCAVLGGAVGTVIVLASINLLPRREIPGEKDFVWMRRR